jgi:hypothetical protein
MVGVGVGTAASAAIEPLVEPGKQEAWSNAANRVLDPAMYAALRAQGAIDLTTAIGLARRSGIGPDRMTELLYLAQRTPTYGEAQDLRRRDKITLDQLRHTFAKAQIEEQYWDALADLVDDRLSAEAVALAIIRSMMRDPGFFPVQLDTTGGVVPAYPVSDIDPVEEAKSHGFSEERLRVMVGSIGRPPGPGELARALFRDLIERPDFNRGILEGDTRPEWAQTFLDVNREILTAGEYAELELRGFYDTATRRQKTAQHGMSQEDSDDLFRVLGRAPSVHQITTGLARGGKYPGNYADVPEPYKSAIQRSNIRPEYAEIEYANRYSYPSFFVLRSLAQDGLFTEAQLEQILLDIGWTPELAKEVATFYTAQAQGAKQDPSVGKAQSKVYTETQKAYLGGSITPDLATAMLSQIVPSSADVAFILELWDSIRNMEAGIPRPA